MIIETSEMPIAEGKEDAFSSRFSSFRDIFMSIPGAVETRLLIDQADARSLTLLMQWDSKESQHAFESDSRFQEWAKGLGEMFAGKPKVRFFDEVS